MGELTEKVINRLLKKNSELEYEVERQQRIIYKALDLVLLSKHSDYINSKALLDELENILRDKKEKEKTR